MTNQVWTPASSTLLTESEDSTLTELLRMLLVHDLSSLSAVVYDDPDKKITHTVFTVTSFDSEGLVTGTVYTAPGRVAVGKIAVLPTSTPSPEPEEAEFDALLAEFMGASEG